jgi:hypothetical protein
MSTTMEDRINEIKAYTTIVIVTDIICDYCNVLASDRQIISGSVVVDPNAPAKKFLEMGWRIMSHYHYKLSCPKCSLNIQP